MKLYYSPLSPFVRKARVAAFELGLADQIELVPITVAPGRPNADYAKDTNPLRKIPALIRDDGSVLYDSGVICEYLDAQAGGGRLLPDGEARWTVLRDHALATGLCDAAVLIRYETWLRPEEYRWDGWTEDQWDKVNNGLTWFEGNPDDCGDAGATTLNLAQITLGCLLGYLDLRFGDRNWRGDCPGLSAWYERVSQRASFKETVPLE
jgi:glutathione S-transferase